MQDAQFLVVPLARCDARLK